MPKRLNIKIVTCFQCPFLQWDENGWCEETEAEYTGYFCRDAEALILVQSDGNYHTIYDNTYGKGHFPHFCGLKEDDFEPLFEGDD